LRGLAIGETTVTSEYVKQALQKVGNPNILINVVSRRVRQLNSSGGSSSRPLIADTAGLGAADIALLEIIEDKLTWSQEGEPMMKQQSERAEA
jgi:DNA-directed RNA polymerase subunit omega